MADEPNVTKNLLDMYSRDDWITKFNFRCFLRLSGLQNVPRESKILDCGCAMGHLIKMLQSFGFKNLTGLDSSREMVEKARGLTGVPIIHADALDISRSVKSGEIDVVIVADLVHHLKSVREYEIFLKGCNDVLKSGGLLIIREPFPTILVRVLYGMSKHKIFHVGFLKARLQSFVEEDALLQYFFEHWVRSYPDLISKHGFKITKDFNWIVHRITSCRKIEGIA